MEGGKAGRREEICGRLKEGWQGGRQEGRKERMWWVEGG